MNSGIDTGVVQAAGYGPPGGGPPGYGPPGGGPPGGGDPSGYGPPGGGGYGGPPGGGGGYGGPPGGGYGGPPGGYGGPPGGGYGAPPGGYGPPGFGGPGGPMMVGGPKVNPLALTSMILGIVSIPACCCWLFSGPSAIAGLVLGIIGLGQVKNRPAEYKGSGFAIAGIICSAVALLLVVATFFTELDDNLRHQYGNW